MNDQQEQNRIAQNATPEPLTPEPNAKPRLKKTRAQPVKPVRIRSSQAWMRPPATPLMLTPTIAWRTLCKKTGGGVHLVTFYKWIERGKVSSVRLGKKIFITPKALDDLILRCLAGDDFYREDS